MEKELNKNLELNENELSDLDSETQNDTEEFNPIPQQKAAEPQPLPTAATEYLELTKDGIRMSSCLLTPEGLKPILFDLLKNEDIKKLLGLDDKTKTNNGSYLG